MIELNPVRRKHALERDKVLWIAVHKGPVEIEQKGRFLERRVL